MRSPAAILYLVYKLWIGLVFWSTLLMLYPLFRLTLSSRRYYPAAFRLKRIWARMLQALLCCPMRVERRAPLPSPPYLIVSNHGSHLDTVFMYSLIPDYFIFMGKGELLKWPLFRRFFRTMDIPVHRGNHRRAYRAMELAADALKRGECVALYPEGTIPEASPQMKPFKNGAFRMAAEAGVPIVPVTWQSNYLILRDPGKIFEPSRPAVVRAVIHPAQYPHGSANEDLVALRDRVFSLIEGALPPEARRSHEN